ncbi:MAG: carboxypeptidase-like regulatory domain-containing protein, partial [Acidobacteriota bacterium]|nr:carboxypeptidase-like regulatory domain-containing protein [Acidobacteriota bacterium]
MVLIILSTLLFSPAAFSQGVTGAITGVVMDPQQAAVAGAKVTVTNVETGSVNTTETNSSGVYNVPSLRIGTYEIRVEAAGFKTYVQQNVAIEVARVVRVDPVLEIGAVGDSV